MAFFKKKNKQEVTEEPILEKEEGVSLEKEEVVEVDDTTDEEPVEQVKEENTLETKEKPKKEKKKRKRGKKGEEIERKEYVLYLIMDKPIDGTLEFFRNFGLNVSRIFNNIQEARDVLMMQIQPSRVVVVDTGTGRFTSMSSRKDLIDLMGISDEENKTTVFYSDSVIKREIEYAKEVEDKYIEWIKYSSTTTVLATLLQNTITEKYIVDNEYKEVAQVTASLNCKGTVLKGVEKVNIGPVLINTSDVIKRQTTELPDYDMLPEYIISV